MERILISLNSNLKRDERIMRYLTVSLDKHGISWAEKKEKQK